MYSYSNYNKQNYQPIQPMYTNTTNDERFGGVVAPLLLGGVAGYAIGNTTKPNYYYPQPYYPMAYNNYYYYPYPYYYR